MSDALTKSYYSISEVSENAGVKAHVLRYWETQFSMLRPRKSRGGVRMYRPKDVALIEQIKHLLYDRGFTIAGARRKLLEDRRSGERIERVQVKDVRYAKASESRGTTRDAGEAEAGVVRTGAERTALVGEALKQIRRELEQLRQRLERLPTPEDEDNG